MTIASLALGGAASATPAQERLLTDFSAASRVSWYTVNDGVMGGRSRGGFKTQDGVLRFAGSTNTNGGGFSSLRTRGVALDLSGYEGVRLRVRADGRRYTFRLTSSTSRRSRYTPSYWAEFETRKDAGWQIVDVPFSRFRPQWRGRRLAGPALDVAKIDGLGLMIYDKRDGPFLFEADWIKAYRKAAPKASLTSYRDKKRPLLVFAPRADDKRLKAQLAEVAKSRGGFDVRDMVLIVVLPTGTAAASDMKLDAQSAQRLRAQLGIKDGDFAVRLVGKDGGVKRSASTPLGMAPVYALVDAMPMRKREQKG